MNDDPLSLWPLLTFFLFFAAMWLAVTTLLGLLSGWYSLRQNYADDAGEKPLLTLRGQSGSMGIVVALSGVLRLRAYPSGLGIGISRMFGPFQRPLKIPWGEIDAEPGTSLFVPSVTLRLGRRGTGRLRISAVSWNRLMDAVPRAEGGGNPHVPPAMPVDRRSVARGFMLQWLAFTGIAAALFFIASRANGPAETIPAGICIVFPAVVVGFGQLLRYRREG